MNAILTNTLYAVMGISYLCICLLHIFGPSHGHEEHSEPTNHVAVELAPPLE